jgi:rhodanese-related sulfurtransferase
MKTISYDQLKKMRDAREDFLLINVLPAKAFDEAHIPDSINIPLDLSDFEAQVEETAEGKSAKIVTYCASFDCAASRNAAEKLEKAGFTNVQAYEGGVKEWQEKSGKRQAAA